MIRTRLAVVLALVTTTMLTTCVTARAQDPNQQETGFGVLLGLLQYVRTAKAQDKTTTTEGTTEGSALLMRQYPALGHTDWFLVEGSALLLNQFGFPPVPVVFPRQDKQIAAVRSYLGGGRGPEFVADQRAVAEMLVDVYQKSRDGEKVALHAPPLYGNGWHNDVGATWEEAEAFAGDMDLTLQRLPDSPTVGLVIAQEPAPGTMMSPSDVLRVRLNGQAFKSQPVGTRQQPDIVRAIATPDSSKDEQSTRTQLPFENATRGRISGRITSFHPDAIAVPGSPARREYVALLPDDAAGKLVTVTPAADESNDIFLSVWHDDGTTLSELRPPSTAVRSGPQSLIQFLAPTSGRTLVVAEHRTRQLMTVELLVAWQPASSESP